MMTHGNKAGAGALVLATLLAAGAAYGAGPAGADAPTTEELEAEIRALRDQVDALRAALYEMVEQDRRRLEALSRAVSAAAPVPRAPGRSGGPASGAPAAPSLDGRGRGAEAAPPSEVAARPNMVAPAAAVGNVVGRVAAGGAPVAYVFVENIRGPLVKGKQVQIKQENKQFVPEWAVVQVGTTIAFPNGDDVYHNVFSLSPGNTFDLGLYRAGEPEKAHAFVRPGAVEVYCNIHPRMRASVLVVPNSYFAKVREDGTYTLSGVPAGKRKVVAWAPGAELSSEWVEVGAAGDATLDFTLTPRPTAHKNKNGQAYSSYE